LLGLFDPFPEMVSSHPITVNWLFAGGFVESQFSVTETAEVHSLDGNRGLVNLCSQL